VQIILPMSLEWRQFNESGFHALIIRKLRM
jgi:hypothetical protein